MFSLHSDPKAIDIHAAFTDFVIFAFQSIVALSAIKS